MNPLTTNQDQYTYKHKQASPPQRDMAANKVLPQGSFAVYSGKLNAQTIPLIRAARISATAIFKPQNDKYYNTLNEIMRNGIKTKGSKLLAKSALTGIHGSKTKIGRVINFTA